MNTDSKLAATAMKKRSKITEKAIQSFQEELDQRQNEEIKEVFNLFDVERKGVINGHNMKICFKTLDIDMQQKEIEDTLKQMFKIEEPIEQIFFKDEDGDILILNNQIPSGISVHLFVEPNSIPKIHQRN